MGDRGITTSVYPGTSYLRGMGAAISLADLEGMKHNGYTRDHPAGAAASPARLTSPARSAGVGRPRSGAGPVGGLTPGERCAVEARIARISAVLHDLDAQLQRLRQTGAPLAPGAPGSPSSAPHPV